MAHMRRATLAPPVVIRFWLLGLVAWAAIVFVVGSAAQTSPNVSTDTRLLYAQPPVSIIPIHVMEETRLRVLRAEMTGDLSEIVTVNPCGHGTHQHLLTSGCDPFAGIPGLAPNNGAVPPWLTDLPTH